MSSSDRPVRGGAGMEEPWPACACGCGRPVPAAKYTDRRRGKVKGEPQKYVRGHNSRWVGVADYRVDPCTGCWVWQRRFANEYGLFRGSTRAAHRVYWERAKGPIPKGNELHHRCGVKACVNPDHLELVTRKEHLTRHGREATSQVPGVSYLKDRGRWRASVGLGNGPKYLGSFLSEAEAVATCEAYREAQGG